MCTKLFHIALYTILLSVVSLVSDISGIDMSGDEEVRMSYGVQHPALAKLTKIRCTRRFTPGVCVDEVAPVWTFVFFAQNCTERLGCPNNYRTNRFRSYRMCMKRCRALVDIYLQMVEFEEKNATTDKNDTLGSDTVDKNDTDEADDKNLRGGFAKYYDAEAGGRKEITLNIEDLTQDLEEEEYKEDEQQTHFIVYKDPHVNEEIMPPDVDYVAGEIRSELDLLHG